MRDNWKIGPERPKPKVSCLFVTSRDQGDHASDISIAMEVAEGETVESLMQRVLTWKYDEYLSVSESPTGQPGRFPGFVLNHEDHIELRIVREAPAAPPGIKTDVTVGSAPRVFRDGDKWCILAGTDLMSGVAGFGDTVGLALHDFNLHLYKFLLANGADPEATQ